MMHDLYAPFRPDEPFPPALRRYLRQEGIHHLERGAAAGAEPRPPPRAARKPGNPASFLGLAARILARLRWTRTGL